MNRIHQAFDHGPAFITFLTAGDPAPDKTVEYILEMERGGADLVEIGIPFSDPIAEGVVIQEANIRALSGHTKIKDVFNIVRNVRKHSQIPLVFMTYVNPVFNYGTERFFADCATTGVDGIIIPDLPFEERSECADVAKKYGVPLISMVAPTSQDRIEAIAAVGDGFLYVVSSLGVTGTRTKITTDLKEMTDLIRSVTSIPAAVGFGINTPEQASAVAAVADGVIVGSAIVKIIGRYKDEAGPHIYDYVKMMKAAVRKAAEK